MFESQDINRLNEDVMGQVTRLRPGGIIGRLLFREALLRSQLWLAALPLDVTIRPHQRYASRMRAHVSNEPYCFKDPRFDYTVPAWLPYLRDVVFVCVFRHPAQTAASIVAECTKRRYLSNLKMTRERALDIWSCHYLHILEKHMSQGDWLFLHFEQALERRGLDRLHDALGARIDPSFPEHKLSLHQRERSDGEVPDEALGIYSRLCNLAGHQAD
jgi:hypothetical protein